MIFLLSSPINRDRSLGNISTLLDSLAFKEVIIVELDLGEEITMEFRKLLKNILLSTDPSPKIF
jgi:hypothetical protein